MSVIEKTDATAFIAALRKLSAALNSYGNKGKFSDSFNPNAAPLDSGDLEMMSSRLRHKFDIDWSSTDPIVAQPYFDDLTEKLTFATANLVPNLHSSANVGEALVGMLYAIDVQISGLITPSVIDQMARLPLNIRRDIKAAQKRFEHAQASVGDLESKVRSINDAYEGAKNLPTTLADLEIAAADIDKSRQNVLRYEADAKQRSEDVQGAQQTIQSVLQEAQQALQRANAAFSAATSEGLAREFKRKAFWLNVSLVIWVLALIVGLSAGAIIGYVRFPVILQVASSVAADGTPNWGVVAVHMLVSILSVGPAVWLAWVATKQIGERFRIAEDYAYKAALSSAYEGYRTEAHNLDPILQVQLFSIAISRLDEIPLRLIDKNVAGSPIHEFLNAPEFREAISKSPGLRDLFLRIFGKKAPTGAPIDETPEAPGKVE